MAPLRTTRTAYAPVNLARHTPKSTAGLSTMPKEKEKAKENLANLEKENKEKARKGTARAKAQKASPKESVPHLLLTMENENAKDPAFPPNHTRPANLSQVFVFTATNQGTQKRNARPRKHKTQVQSSLQKLTPFPMTNFTTLS